MQHACVAGESAGFSLPVGSFFTQRLAKVEKTVHEDENGEKYLIPTLAPHENPDVPEQFLVVRA